MKIHKKEIRMVNTNGQISIGKEVAGQAMQVVRQDKNTWIITKGQFIPDNERWLYRDNNLEKLMEAVEWSENNPRKDNFEELMELFEKRITANE